MIIKRLPVGPIGTNCYVVGCPETKKAVVIDPGDEAEKIMRTLESNGLEIEAIINTHGHWDHVGANRKLKDLTGVPILIHRDDAGFLNDGKLNLASFMGDQGLSPAADRILQEGDEISVGNLSFRVLHTPGHTPGGISLVGDGVVFVGDTLFAGSIGRTDFPGGDFKTLIRSIKEKLLVLGDDMIAYSGHGPETTIGREKRGNPFLV